MDKYLAETIYSVENDIDSAFASNSLKEEGYTQAAWTLLSVTEDYLLKIFNRQPDDLEIFTDIYMNALTYPLRVCQQECLTASQKLVKKLRDRDYQLAWDWLKLASHDYFNFHSLFPLWHRGKVEVSVDVDTRRLFVTTPRDDKSYEAYNRLFPKDARRLRVPKKDLPNFDALVAPKTTTWRNEFQVHFDPRLVSQLRDLLNPVALRQYTLPDNWTFGDVTLGQFRAVLTTLQAMMMGWFTARLGLANAGMPGMGFSSAVWIVEKSALAARLRRYTGVELGSLQRILELLTFGSSGIRYPDIATQPLIDLRNGEYALSPFVWTGTNPERNLCALLNQIPQYRKAYSKLVDEKEDLLREEIKAFLEPLGLELRNGPLESTDLDAAIIDDRDRCCLALELKWFIEPAEIREVEDRTEDLRTGVEQCKKLLWLYQKQDSRLQEVLGIEPGYRFAAAVASVNWIGHAAAQDRDVPIIKIWHLLEKIRSNSLREVMDWLAARQYLPVSEKDYAVREMEISCGGWKCEWYGIEPLGLCDVETIA